MWRGVKLSPQWSCGARLTVPPRSESSSFTPEFERRQARPPEAPASREEEASDFQQKMEEARQPPPRMRPVPSLVPRPPQTSLVKFVGNMYTLKCRFVWWGWGRG